MSTSVNDVLTAALRLPEDQRWLIAQRLLATLPAADSESATDDDEFYAELQRRSGDWDGSVEWSELRAELDRTA